MEGATVFFFFFLRPFFFSEFVGFLDFVVLRLSKWGDHFYCWETKVLPFSFAPSFSPLLSCFYTLPFGELLNYSCGGPPLRPFFFIRDSAKHNLTKPPLFPPAFVSLLISSCSCPGRHILSWWPLYPRFLHRKPYVSFFSTFFPPLFQALSPLPIGTQTEHSTSPPPILPCLFLPRFNRPARLLLS